MRRKGDERQVEECEDLSSRNLNPVTDIPCKEQCGPGEYFGIDTKFRSFNCLKCPKNTYSTGGGVYIDGEFGEWSTALKPEGKLQ